MNELERIKEIEREVAGEIERARRAADARINEIKSREKQIIQREVEKAKAEMEKKAKEAEIKAREDAEKIIADGKKQVMRIRKLASRRDTKAIELVVKELKGG